MTSDESKFPPQPWMTAPETRAVLAALTAGGAEVRFVGGCVRDSILGRPVNDVDIATHDRPEDVVRLLEAANLKAVPTGIKHGTVTAVADGKPFEITTLREDVETDGRHAKVAFTDDWAADAARRDFTMNALYLSPDGTLHDPVGGIDDLRAGRVRFVGEAEARIREDVLRLLRFFRIYAHYGTPPPDQDALAGCRLLADLLPTLSGERVAAETLKLLSAPDPAPVVGLMAEAGVLAQFLPEAADFGRLGALTRLEAAWDVPDPLRRLAALLGPGEAGARAVAERLRFSGRERDRLAAMAGGLMDFAPEADAVARRRWFYRRGADLYRDLSLLHWAGAIDADPEAAEAATPLYRAGLDAAAAWTPPKLPVTGKDALALDVPDGKRVGEILGAVEDWWAAGDFQADREAAMAKLRALAREK